MLSGSEVFIFIPKHIPHRTLLCFKLYHRGAKEIKIGRMMGSRPALHTAATALMPGMSPERQQDTAWCWFVFILLRVSEMKDYIPVRCQLTAM